MKRRKITLIMFFIMQIMSRGEYPGLNFCKKVLRITFLNP